LLCLPNLCEEEIVFNIEINFMPLVKKVFSTLFFLFFVIVVWAQQFKERVYLKDSITFYEGYVIEQAPAKYVKIYRLQEKDTMTVPLTDVLKLTKIYVIDTVEKIKAKKKLNKTIENKYQKVAFIELLGAGGLYSINYDMRTAKGKRDGWGFRVGVEKVVANITDTSVSGVVEKSRISFTAIPIVLNYLFGKRKGFLELGVGATYFKFKGESNSISTIERYQEETFNQSFGSIIGSFNIGYRHVPYKNGFMYRVALTPLLIEDNFV
jgi:hypothetical protein